MSGKPTEKSRQMYLKGTPNLHLIYRNRRRKVFQREDFAVEKKQNKTQQCSFSLHFLSFTIDVKGITLSRLIF